MTQIIWTLYLADVVGSISVVTALAGFGAFAAVGLASFAASVENHKPPTWRKQALIIGAILWAVSAILPSKTTLYAIAATQAGDEVLKTETGDKAVRALNAWLDRQIAGEEEEGK